MSGRISLLISARSPGTVEVTCLRGDDAGISPALWRGNHTFDAAQAEDELRALERSVRRLLRRPGPDSSVAEHGRLLFDLLLPPPIKAALRGEPGGTLLIAPGPLAHVPWPLLHDGVGALGLRWALGEIPPGEGALDRPATLNAGSARLLLVADPAGDLPAARFEGEALMRDLAGTGGVACDLRLGHLRRADFLRIFKSFRMIHFAGHADAPEGWRLADGHVGPADLETIGGEAAPLLVFANACRSAATDMVAGLLGAGVRHVVGTSVDLPDLPGADFALCFYGALLQGASVGEALRRARAAMAQADSPVWCAYRLFGDPRTVYFDRRVAEQWAPGVRQAVVLAARREFTADGPEAFAEQHERWRTRARAVVQSHGGRLLPGRGAVTRAVFGFPFSYENDGVRAARAALALAEMAPDARVILEAGPLVSTGLDVVGPAAGAAEAAVWQADPGAAVLPEAARRLAARARLGAGAGARPLLAVGAPALVAEPPLVGRLQELARLEAAVRQAVSEGQAGAATLLAPAGMGKSRLASALGDRLAHEVRVVRGASIPYDEVHPFAATAQVLRALLDLEAEAPDLRARLLAALDRLDDAPEPEDFLSIDALLAGDAPPRLRDRADALAAVLGLHTDGRPDPSLVPVAVREVVAATGRVRPLLLIFEDLHWMPEAGLAVVDELILGLGEVPVFVLGTARLGLLDRAPRWGVGARHLRLDLGPLPAREAAALLRQVVPTEISAQEIDALAERAEGNPLFLRELGLARADGAGDTAIPPTVEAVMQARLDRRSALEREVLRAGAIFGRSFWLAGVERLLGPGRDVRAALHALTRARFVLPQPQTELPGEEEWRFAHALLHAVVLRGTGARARRAWHGRAALWLDEEVPGREGRFARIAAHRSAAGDHARAAEAWLDAAERADTGLAPAESRKARAAALIEDDAAEQAFGDERRAAIEATLAEQERAAGELDAAAALLDAALARDRAPVRLADRLRRRAEVDEARGDLDSARRRLAEALVQLDAAAPDGRTVRVVVERDLAWLDYRDGAYEDAVRRLSAVSATLSPDEHTLTGPVHNALGVVAYGRGEHDKAAHHYRLALAAFEALGDARRMSAAYNNLGMLAMRQGDFGAAESWYQRGLRIKAEGGDREGLARAYNNLGSLYGETGDYPKAARYLSESIRIRERSGHAGLAVGYANLGEVYLKQGHHADARGYLERAIALCEAGKGPGYLLPDAWRMLAELRLALDEPAAAAAAARAALALADDSGDRPRAGVANRVLGAALAAAQDAAADTPLRRAIEIFEDLEQPLELAKAYAARARFLGDGVEARALEQQARTLLDAVGARQDLAL